MLRAGLGLVLLTAFLLVGTLVLPLVGGVSVKGAVAQETRSVIAGTVTDSSGQPVARMWIKAEASETSEQSLTTRDGAFGIRVADGEYRLKIYSDRFSTCTVSGYENPESRWDAPFIIGGNDVTGIHVSVGGIPGEFSVWTPCRFDVPSTRIQEWQPTMPGGRLREPGSQPLPWETPSGKREASGQPRMEGSHFPR